MTPKKIILLTALLIPVFSGCVEPEESIVEQKINKIAAEIDFEDTKTSVTDEGYFTWSSGDQIWLHTTSGSVAGTLSSGAGTPNAYFSYGYFVGELTGKSVYPYNENHSISGEELSVVLPSVYNLGSNVENTNAIMYGVLCDGSIKYTHMAGLMRFTLNNVPAGVNQFKLTLDKKISGTFLADLSETHPQINTTETDDEEEKTITLNFDPLISTANLNLYFPLPVGTYNTLSLELNSATETVWQYSNSVTNSVKRKALLLMPEVTMSGIVDGVIENDAFDQNAYITYESGSYQVTSGDSYWLMRPFLLSRVSTISDIELKFQMVSDDQAYLFYSERPYINNGAVLNNEGLKLRFNNSGYYVTSNEVLLTWKDMEVEPTDCIVLRISVNDGTVTVNDKSIAIPGVSPFTDIEYLFSSYFYESDDGYAKTYWAVPIGSKLYYAKIYNDSGEVIYVGHASEGEYIDGTTQYAWESEYNDQTYMEFAGTNFEPFWVRTYIDNLTHFGGGVDVGGNQDGGHTDYVDLSESGTANSYIVTEAGAYKFTPTKGSSTEPVGEIASLEVLWETFGTDVTPEVGDLIKKVKYENGIVSFETPSVYREGNAVIAAKDASGTILWSWHIWLTDQPEEQVYYNNAGTMMDRNLGATSTTPGDVGTLGLLYQWGRKDPFLGSSSISSNTVAKSTITWPASVQSDSSSGTIEYTTANPTTFIGNNGTGDWCYATDNTLWAAADAKKSPYDPCPVGWRIPAGGDYGIWSKAFGSANAFRDTTYDSINKGIDFCQKLGSSGIIWYPVPGYLQGDLGTLTGVGSSARYWGTPYREYGSYFAFGYDYYVFPSGDNFRVVGQSVRCIKEGSYEQIQSASYTLQLSPTTYGWTKSTTVSNPDPTLYDGVYESTNQGVSDSQSYMYIDISGYENFKFYVRSNAESDYDYLVVSELDGTIDSSSYSGDSDVKFTTQGNQVSDSSISAYSLVEFSNIGGGEHRITIMYRKDYSVDYGNDKGYVLIPKNQ